MSILGGILGGLASGILGASSAKSAADSQSDAIRYGIDRSAELTAPYRTGGQQGFDALLFEYGLGEAPQGYEGYQLSNFGQSMLTQGVDDIEAAMAKRGMLNSGATATALEDYRQQVVGADRNSFLAGLSGIGAMGQASATNSAANVQAGYNQIGQSNAAGALGVGNALTGGINTGFNIYGYLNPGATA